MGVITLNHIEKIEGHARLDLHIKDNKLEKCELGSIEGSRYFEGILKGRDYKDVPEITSRICGICSSAHGVAAVMAIENAFDMKVSEQTVILRELQTIGERIRSHATHLYFLALPDYLGYESALAMKDKYKEELSRALRLVKLGNDMVTIISGRVMHQVSNWVGGFTHLPSQEELDSLKKRLSDSKKDVIETAKLISSLKVPEFKRKTRYFSLSRKDAYATSHGDLKVDEEIFEQNKYSNMIKEYHEPYSNANFVVKDEKSYYVGALARVNNNHLKLSPQAKRFMKSIKLNLPEYNSFMNNLCQAIELLHYQEVCVKILSKFKVKYEKPIVPRIKAGHGISANEAPRGTLIHEYKIDNNGKIIYANIVTPTAAFLRNMQEDVAEYVVQLLEKNSSEEEIKKQVSMLIRSYDPCFSCATHCVRIIRS
jgi:sulfhydrogenase subunit alpha